MKRLIHCLYAAPLAAMATLLLITGPASAEASTPSQPEASSEESESTEPSEDEAPEPTFTFQGHFVTLGHVRSDSDFDPSERYYDVDGQTEGQVATYFRPLMTVTSGGFELRYEAELGWNVWSRNTHGLNNDYFANGDGLALRHRQLWAGYRFSEDVALRAGYQPLRDPSGLFLDHHAGALAVDFAWLGVTTTLWVGQLPDSTFEGISAKGDNFVTDSFAFGLDNQWACSGLSVDVGLYGLHDMRVVDQPLSLMTALAGIRYETDNLEVSGQLLGQLGQWVGSGVGGSDQSILAWAAQARLTHHVGAFSWSVGTLVLSGDDPYQGNGTLHGFFGSGKNQSPSTWLSEDEIRDRFDNLDEQIATAWGAFFLNRPGLALIDATASFEVSAWYTPQLVAATGLTLAPDNALGETFVGAEIGIHNRFALGDHVQLVANLQLLLPGGAAAAFVNEVDRRAAEMAFGAQLGMLATF